LWAGTWGNDIGVSQDGGETLVSLGNGLETLSVLDILWHPSPGQVTAATIEGLYRTDDGGRSWFQLPGPLTRQTIYNLLQTDDGTIWAAAADGLWASADYGVTWARAEGMPITTVVRLGLLATARGDTWFWAGTEGAGLWLSNDGGQTWYFGGLTDRTIYNLLSDPLQPNRLVAATEQGLFEASVEGLLGPASR
jgi:ligand-binding sensor domain-containing protein